MKKVERVKDEHWGQRQLMAPVFGWPGSRMSRETKFFHDHHCRTLWLFKLHLHNFSMKVTIKERVEASTSLASTHRVEESPLCFGIRKIRCCSKKQVGLWIPRCPEMCRLSWQCQRHSEKNRSSNWHGLWKHTPGLGTTFSLGTLPWALPERTPSGRDPDPDQETQFCKIEEENPRDGEGCWAGWGGYGNRGDSGREMNWPFVARLPCGQVLCESVLSTCFLSHHHNSVFLSSPFYQWES